jgi:AraC-like DNA-binding protein
MFQYDKTMKDLPVVSRSLYRFDNRFFTEAKRYGHINLLQIGDIMCEGSSLVAEHDQPCFEITYTVSGEGKIYINGNRLQVGRGNIVVSLKGDRHSIVSDSNDPLRYFFLAFEMSVSHPLFGKFKTLQYKIRDPAARLRRDNFSIEDIFIRCLGEFANPNEFSDVIIESCLNQILCYVFQTYNLINYSYHPVYENQESLVYKMVNYVDENILKIQAVDDVFRHFGYSASYMSHIFTKYMHKTLKRYIVDCKLKRSLALMSNSDYTLTKIADALGYASIHSFSKAFKGKYKTAPSSWLSGDGNMKTGDFKHAR